MRNADAEKALRKLIYGGNSDAQGSGAPFIEVSRADLESALEELDYLRGEVENANAYASDLRRQLAAHTPV